MVNDGVEPSRVGVVAMWLAATITLTTMLCLGVRKTGDYAAARYAVHYAYEAALVWHLAWRGPAISHLAECPLGPSVNGRLGRLAAAAAALLFCLTGLGDAGLFLLGVAVSVVAVLVVWRRQVTWRAAAFGVGVSALAFLAGGIPFWRHGFVQKPILVFMLAAVPPMFVAGGLLVARTGLGAIRLLDGRYGIALRSFIWGAVLFIPFGLSNAAGSVRPGLDWVNRWWQPLTLPLWSGIGEEVVYRTVAVCLSFALLRPSVAKSARLAVVAAVVFSAASFGLAHGRTLNVLFVTGLGYGLPMAVIFARRDWEHAVGAHYMINMVPWVMAFLRV